MVGVNIIFGIMKEHKIEGENRVYLKYNSDVTSFKSGR